MVYYQQMFGVLTLNTCRFQVKSEKKTSDGKDFAGEEFEASE